MVSFSLPTYSAESARFIEQVLSPIDGDDAWLTFCHWLVSSSDSPISNAHHDNALAAVRAGDHDSVHGIFAQRQSALDREHERQGEHGPGVALSPKWLAARIASSILDDNPRDVVHQSIALGTFYGSYRETVVDALRSGADRSVRDAPSLAPGPSSSSDPRAAAFQEHLDASRISPSDRSPSQAIAARVDLASYLPADRAAGDAVVAIALGPLGSLRNTELRMHGADLHRVAVMDVVPASARTIPNPALVADRRGSMVGFQSKDVWSLSLIVALHLRFDSLATRTRESINSTRRQHSLAPASDQDWTRLSLVTPCIAPVPFVWRGDALVEVPSHEELWNHDARVFALSLPPSPALRGSLEQLAPEASRDASLSTLLSVRAALATGPSHGAVLLRQRLHFEMQTHLLARSSALWPGTGLEVAVDSLRSVLSGAADCGSALRLDHGALVLPGEPGSPSLSLQGIAPSVRWTESFAGSDTPFTARTYSQPSPHER